METHETSLTAPRAPKSQECQIILRRQARIRSAKRKGLKTSPESIARNIKNAKRERRERLMILRRSWIPSDDPGEHRPPRRANRYPPG
jgi:hypothetical protein